ncbi:MAG: pyridoxal-phosphate dependent enzyme [Solirubrobacteraceae bacterium]
MGDPLPTPLQRAPPGLVPGREVWLKREDAHELGSFKWRGAMPTLQKYRNQGADTVVTASTGNHGAATAWAAARLDMAAIVYAPTGLSQIKLARMQDLGAEVRLVGVDVDQAKDAAAAFARSEGWPFFEDGAEPTQFAGYQAIGEEVLKQSSQVPAAVVVPVGNGALLVGVGSALGRAAPEVERVGVVAEAAPVMALSYHARAAVGCDRCDTFADGLAVRVAIPSAVAEIQDAADRMVRVSEREIARAVGAYATAGIRAEGAAGAGLAALAQVTADPVVVIMCGSNIDDELHTRAVQHPESFPG